MDKFYLFLEYYNSDNPDRQKELIECLENNVASGLFHKIYCFTQVLESDRPNIDIIEWIYTKNRQTIYDVIKYINGVNSLNGVDSENNNYFVISNADIWFNDTLLQTPHMFDKLSTPSRPLCMAITRHNVINKQTKEYILHDPVRESQDCWIFRDTIIDMPDTDFYFGLPGCDNRMVAILRSASYNVINPCKTIQLIHNHLTDYRTYSNKDRVKGAYAFVEAYKG